MWVRSAGWEDPLEEGMTTRSSILDWRIPGMGEPGGLPSTGSHRVRHDWSDLTAAAPQRLCPRGDSHNVFGSCCSAPWRCIGCFCGNEEIIFVWEGWELGRLRKRKREKSCENYIISNFVIIIFFYWGFIFQMTLQCRILPKLSQRYSLRS